MRASDPLAPPRSRARRAPAARRDVPAAAWRAFHDAARRSPGYARALAERGRPAEGLTRWGDIPFLDRHAVFGADPAAWVPDGLAAAAELVCSSGHSGRPRALGVVARDAEGGLVDRALAALGASPASPTLLVNLLPMGIALPTRLATLCAPSVHPEMALEVLERYTAAFDRVVLAAEPLFLAEVARRWAQAPPHGRTWVFTGGEWVPEPLRARVARLLGMPAAHRVIVSLGAAELGLHVLHETPPLADARGALAARPGIAAELGLTVRGGAVAPALFTWDAERVHVETRRHDDGDTTLAVTTLGAPALPLIRYDLGDLGRVLDAAEVRALGEATGAALPDDVALVHGRRAALALPGGTLRPEAVAERLWGDEVLADAVTGRFRLRRAPDGAVELHLEGRGPQVPPTAALAGWLATRCGGPPCRVVAHGAGTYPHHAAGDWTHKARYLDPAGEGRP
ncbi:MAG TPA: hypothetical protein VNT51_07475 [Miltoncostaeaceae bacterium]|nr:hypothetical protein [Miltoncostaeaceae bacterium]